MIYICVCVCVAEFLALGAAVPEVDIDARIIDVQPGNCASLIYTSGTTGAYAYAVEEVAAVT